MRMRGLEPPRGSPRSGGRFREVAGSGTVEPNSCSPPHGCNHSMRGVCSRSVPAGAAVYGVEALPERLGQPLEVPSPRTPQPPKPNSGARRTRFRRKVQEFTGVASGSARSVRSPTAPRSLVSCLVVECRTTGSSARRRDASPPPWAYRIAECQGRLGRLRAAAERRLSRWGNHMGSPFATATHRLPISILRLSDRITRQRVGSTQQLVLAGTRGAQALGAGMFVPRARPPVQS
jgi:hypothetical protein